MKVGVIKEIKDKEHRVAFQGSVTSQPVAEALGLLSQYKEFAALL